MDARRKSDDWFLERINIKNTEKYYLCENDATKIGRNREADIATDSEFSSRSHCTIRITGANEILLTDMSSNGTFVNNILIKDGTRLLQINDIIGIGCNMSTFDATQPTKYFLFKLKSERNVPIVKSSVDLTIDDDEDGIDTKEHIRQLIKKVKPEPVLTNNVDLLRLKQEYVESSPIVPIMNVFAQPEAVAGSSSLNVTTNNSTNRFERHPSYSPLSSDNNELSPPPTNHEAPTTDKTNANHASEDGDECFQHSQQIIFNIKQEAHLSFTMDDDEESDDRSDENEHYQGRGIENYNDENDNVRVIVLDDDEQQYRSWNTKLSQDQDKVIEKLKKSTERTDTDRKYSKMIAPMPLAKRRRSCSEREPTHVPPKRRRSRSEREPVASTASFSRKIGLGTDGKANCRNQISSPIRRKSISEDQKDKLAKIARESKEKAAKAAPIPKTSTRPKVKSSKSRADFLAEKPPSIIEARRKSVDERRSLISKSPAPEEANRYETILRPKGVPVKRVSRVPSQHERSNGGGTTPPQAHVPTKIVEQKRKSEVVIQPLGHIDPKDPYKKLCKPEKMTLEEALTACDAVNNNVRIRRRRFSQHNLAFVKQKEEKNSVKSILKPLNRPQQKTSRRLLWRDNLCDIKEFEQGDYESDEIIIQNGKSLSEEFAALSAFHRNPIHKVISQITQWHVDWLSQKGKRAPVNGGPTIPQLVTKYPNFHEYQRMITKVMMCELWAGIEADYSQNARAPFLIELLDVFVEKRGLDMRKIFVCEVGRDLTGGKLNLNEFLIVRADGHKFFAYITEIRYRTFQNNKISFTMESAVNSYNSNIDVKTPKVTITPLSNIRSEMKLFSAVFTLADCRLREQLLNPLEHIHATPTNDHKKFVYNGYEALSDEQMRVLKEVFFDCTNPQSAHVALIGGPPGTGKSRVIVALILQLIFGQINGQKIMLCASSNAAVDLIAAKLLKIRSKMGNKGKSSKFNIVRFGVPERIRPDLQEISLQALLQQQIIDQNKSKDVQYLKEELSTLTKQLEYLSKDRAQNTRADKMEKIKKKIQQIKDNIKISGSARIGSRMEMEYTRQILDRATIVCTTLSSAINILPHNIRFDTCIVDEASQCTEPWTLVPLLFNLSSLVLVGDTQQLPAIVLSAEAKECNLDRSLFERIQDAYIGSEIKPNVYPLCEQFRMHPEICAFSNEYFYFNELKTNEKAVDQNFPLHPYTVFSLDFTQSNQHGTTHVYNMDEAHFVINVLKVTMEYASPARFSYGIITPYSGQRDEIIKRLREQLPTAAHKIPVNTIDSYQGQEKDIIIISNARTVGTGFLNEPKRLNVAMTRARKALIICANFSSLKSVQVWEKLLNDAKQRNRYHKAKNDVKNITKSLVKKNHTKIEI